MRKIVVSFLVVLVVTVVVCPQGVNRTWLNGTWEGTGYQIDNNSTWTMKLVARQGGYTIEYPSLNCGGRWRLLRIDSWRARFTEHITSGREVCVDRGNVVIQRLSRRQIAYRFSERGAAAVSASAILNRKK